MMQVVSEQAAPAAASHYGDRSPAESDILPHPPLCPPPVYQLSLGGSSFSDNVAPPPYDVHLGYKVPSVHGYALPADSQLPNYYSLHHSVTGLVVSAQPPVTITQPTSAAASPPTYLGWSTFNFLCCFWPLGLAAIIYSMKVSTAHNHEEAKRHSLTARNLNIAATTIAPVIVLVAVGAALGLAGKNTAGRSSSYTSSGDSYRYSTYSTNLMYYTVSDFGSYFIYSRRYNAYYDDYIYSSYITTGFKYFAASKYVDDS